MAGARRRSRRKKDLEGEEERVVYLGEEEREANSLVKVVASEEFLMWRYGLPEVTSAR